MKHVYEVTIGRIVLSGVVVGPADRDELRALISAELARGLRDAALPEGRALRTGVQVQAPALTLSDRGGVGQVARTVAQSVAGALRATGGAGG
jgi:hypothetical protein